MTGAIARGALLKGRYRLERLLGRGGMAVVWLGHDAVLDRPVAVKVPSDAIATDPEFVTRFRREATVAAGLSHPNLVGVYDFSEEGERPYLVMQFVPGDDVAAHLARGERVDCGRLARELLAAVAHIHDAGILHRDIKPQNILLEPGGTAKLLDFGIAVPHDATSLTQTGLVLGTKRYAAPEVVAGRPATERSDLYSCGVVLGCCLGESPAPALRSLVGWLTAADPRSRPASARQALALLDRELPPLGQPTRPFAPSLAEPTQPFSPLVAPRRPDRRAATVALLGALALTVVAILAWGGGSGERGERAVSAAEAKGRRHDAARQARPAGARAVAGAGADAALGSALNEEGFALIQAGEYEAAVPVLEEAVRAFPPGTDDIDYAYALFNLGDALRRSGHPEAAIPVLEERLRIPDQTGTVQAELEAARSEAGAPGREDD